MWWCCCRYTYSSPLPESYASDRWAAGTPLPTAAAPAAAAGATEPATAEAKLQLLGADTAFCYAILW